MIHGVKRLFEEITSKEVRSQIPIKEGITNENYLINDAYVFRLPRKDHDELINYKLEKEVYEKIEPKLRKNDPFMAFVMAMSGSELLDEQYIYV